MRAKWKLGLVWLALAAVLSPVAHAACTYSISPGSRTHGAGATTNSVTVNAGLGCVWTVENTNAWISILAGASGTSTGLVTYAVAANPNPLERTGVVVIASNTFTIRQSALTCSISLSPTTRTHGPGVAANFITINANGAGCAWTVSNGTPWISILSATSGSGSSTVDYQVDANPGLEWRTGVVMVAGQSFSVIQRGITCEYDLTPSTRSHGHAGASNGFSVTATAGCAWTVTNPHGWITIVTGAGGGTGDGVIGYTVAANPGGQGRTGLVTVADQVFTLVQSGQPCSYSILPLSAAHGAGSETGLVTVTATTGCGWGVGNSNDWITIDSGASGLGSGTVGYTVDANPGPGPRSGSFTIDGLTFTLTQPAPACFYKLSPTNRVHGYSAATNQFSITVAAGCPWSVVNTSAWIHLLSDPTGSTSAVVGYSIEANTSPSSRTGTILVEGQPLTLTQLGISCGISVSPVDRMHGHGAASNSLAVTAAAGCDWAAATTNAWITIAVGTNGTGNGTVGYTVEPNPSGLARIGTIMVADEVFTISQSGAPCSWSILPGSRNHGHGAASNGVAVTATPDCAWTVVNTNPWITIVTGASGAGDGTVGYTISANPSINPRSGTLVIAGAVFSISQLGAPCSFSLMPTEGVHGFHVETGMVRVTAISGCPWTVSNTNAWVAITSGAGGGTQSGTVGYALATNPGSTPRFGYLIIAGESFVISQGATTCNYRLSPTNRTHGYAAASNYVTLTVSNGCAWSVVNTNPWVTITTQATGSGGATIGYTVAANGNVAARSGVVLIGGQPFTVNQNGANCDIALSPVNRMHGPGAASNAVTVTDTTACGWSIQNSYGWLQFLASSGTGSSVVGYTVAGNTTAVERVGVVFIGGESLTITQQAANCAVSLSPVNRMHGSGAASNAVIVTDSAGCGWTVINTNGWISFLVASGSGNTTAGYLVAANTTAVERTGVVLVGGTDFTVVQQAANCDVSVSPASRIHGSGAATNSVSVSDDAGCGWTIVNTNGWISFPAASGSGDTMVMYTVAANASPVERSGLVLIDGLPFMVTQLPASCVTSISPVNRMHGSGAATNIVTVTDSAGCGWSVVNTNAWVSIHTPLSGAGSGVVGYSIEANTSLSPRTAVIGIADEAFTINQAGYVCTYRLSPSSRTHGFLATTNTFIVNTTSNCAWSVVNTNPWVTILSGASGLGSNQVTYSVVPNLTTNLRSGVLVVGDGALNLSQRGATNGFSFEVIAIQDGSQLRLRMVGAPTGAWELQGSSDLRNWTRISDVTNVTGVIEYIDSTPATLNHRFFRALLR